MTPNWLVAISVFAILIASASATAVQVLHEFYRHKLEEYCRRRGNLDWHTRIIELREELALGASTLQMISIATALICGLLAFFHDRSIATASSFALLGLIGLWSLILLAANCWIPWGVRKIAAPSFLYRTWRLWWAVALLLAPLTAGVEVVSTLFQRMTGKEEIPESEEDTFEEEIKSMVSEGEHDGMLDHDAREMIEGVFELDDSVVGKVMTPRSKVDVVDVSTSLTEVTRLTAENGRTRLPVVEGQFQNAQDVIGILLAKDLLAQHVIEPGAQKSLRELVRDVMVVPQTKLLDEMLQQFLDNRTHMALVVDEYGSVAGVITMEDILEEIVGEIVDEKDDDQPEDGQIIWIHEKVVEADGTVRIDRLNDELGLALPENGEFDTLSGLIMSSLKTIPKRGQQLQIDEVQVNIEQASRRSIERVRLTILDANGFPNGDDL
ncbi:MAG: hemolysin family protein [Pirellulaceae bacterium]|nr:hemolysin family protein [Pirellulaceae bacterium]MDG2102853.1 hemolysin family protein [Pirellulaceae bacterium]